MKNLNWKIVVVVVLSLIVGITWLIVRSGSSAEEISYRDMPIERGEIVVTILATGTVQPQNRLSIKAPVAGRMEEILVQEGAKVRKGQILAWMSSTERAAMLDAARAQGAESYKKWSEYYLATPVIAPIAGTLIQKGVEPGQTFTTTDAIFVMSDHLTVKAQVDETDLSQIKVKDEAIITLDAYPQNTLAAYVDKIAFDATTVSNVTTYIVDVIPRETPEYMRSGMTANVTFLVEKLEDVLLVPSDAIKIESGQQYVMVPSTRKKEGERHPLRTGVSDGRNTVVLEGLKDGDKILIPEFKIKGSDAGGANPFGMPRMNRSKSGGSAPRPPGP